MLNRRSVVIKLAFIILGVIGVCFYGWLRIDNARFIHESRTFGDSSDYFRIASISVFAKQFWTESKPPIASLIWKFVDRDPNNIFRLQLIISILSWGILALSVSNVINVYQLKPVVFGFILIYSLSRDIYMWDPFLGSESLALSFTALFISSAIWLLNGWRWHRVGLLLLTGFLIVFTRDTFAYFLLMIAVIIPVIFWYSCHRWGVMGISLAFIVFYIISSALAVAGLRPYRAVMMITALRIYPSTVYTDYFRQHGMPVDENLVGLSRNPHPGEKFAVNIALYFDEAQAGYRKWLLEHGRNEYAKFLWFYKADTLQKVFLETPQESFYPDVYYYTATGYRPIIKDARLRELIYPNRFGLVYFFGVNIIAAFIAYYACQKKKTQWLAPLLLIFLAYPQAVLVWAGDANDIARHSIPHNVMFRLGVWILFWYVIDSFTPLVLSRVISFRKRATEYALP